MYLKSAFIILLILMNNVYADVCGDIQNAYSESLNKFRNWKGNLYIDGDPSMGHYSTHLLPGATECLVESSDGLSEYQCEWDFTDKNSTQEAYNSLIHDIKQCQFEGTFPDVMNKVKHDKEYTSFFYENFEINLTAKYHGKYAPRLDLDIIYYYDN